MDHPAFSPLALGRLRLRNRILKTATYEGMVVDGLPGASLLRHHRDIARGGAAMTTVAYCAVADEGRTFENQIVMRPAAVAPFRAITDAVHAEGALAMLQLGHAGGFSKDTRWRGRRGPLGPSFGFNAYGSLKGMPFTFPMSEGDMRRTEDAFASASSLAAEAGFDAVELHLGHGYLLSQFLSPARNRRSDDHGGSLDNRLRFPLAVVERVRREAAGKLAIFAKMNLEDGIDGGLQIDEAVAIARALESARIDAIVLSGGLVTHSPLHLLRGGRPLAAMIDVETHPLQKVALRLFGPRFVRAVPFEPCFFLPLARRVRAAVKTPLVLLGGVTSLDDLSAAMDGGFEMVAMGRALLHDPEHVNKLQRGETTRSGCEPCNLCITEMDRPGGVVCARVPAQLAARADEVSRGVHLRRADQ